MQETKDFYRQAENDNLLWDLENIECTYFTPEMQARLKEKYGKEVPEIILEKIAELIREGNSGEHFPERTNQEG